MAGDASPEKPRSAPPIWFRVPVFVLRIFRLIGSAVFGLVAFIFGGLAVQGAGFEAIAIAVVLTLAAVAMMIANWWLFGFLINNAEDNWTIRNAERSGTEDLD